MEGDSQIQLSEVSIGEMMDFLEDSGYALGPLSNEEVVELYVSVIDGHADEADETEELHFGDY